MTEVIFSLGALMSILCAILLFRGFKQERSTLLLWSSLCFAFLALNNTILFVDVVVLFPDIDFRSGVWRNLTSAIASSLLVFGLIWEIN